MRAEDEDEDGAGATVEEEEEGGCARFPRDGITWYATGSRSMRTGVGVARGASAAEEDEEDDEDEAARFRSMVDLERDGEVVDESR